MNICGFVFQLNLSTQNFLGIFLLNFQFVFHVCTHVPKCVGIYTYIYVYKQMHICAYIPKFNVQCLPQWLSNLYIDAMCLYEARAGIQMNTNSKAFSGDSLHPILTHVVYILVTLYRYSFIHGFQAVVLLLDEKSFTH